MIIRRLAESIKNQDWFVVVLEILIVVIGIFLGLQADAWNQDRKDRLEERAYLERLSTDIRRDLEMLKFGRQLTADRIEQIRFLESVVRDPHLAADSPNRFLLYLETSSWASYFHIGPRTYEELLSSGRTTLLRDPELRDALAEYYRGIDRWDVILDVKKARFSFQEATAGLLNSDQLTAIETLGEADFEMPGVDPDEVLALAREFAAKDEAVRFLPRMLHYHVLAEKVIGGHENSARTMLDRLDAALASGR